MEIIGIGTDIIECERISRMIERHPDMFLERVYTEAEREYCGRMKSATESYAGRWAAKEAVLKAIGTGWIKGIAWTDVEVVKLSDGRPTIELHDGALAEAEARGIRQILITISHCKCHATATAIALG